MRAGDMATQAITNAIEGAKDAYQRDVYLAPEGYAELQRALHEGVIRFTPSNRDNERPLLYLALCLLAFSQCKTRSERESLAQLLSKTVRVSLSE